MREITYGKGGMRIMKQFLNAKEVSQILGVSDGKAYQIIRELNRQLEAQGYITISGKINRRFFEEKCLYGCVTDGD